MDDDRADGITTTQVNDLPVNMSGSLRFTPPTSGYYDKVQYTPSPRKAMSRSDLIRRWLDGDWGFSCSKYRYWLDCAQGFLNRTTYSKTEHTDLLVRAFERYMRER